MVGEWRSARWVQGRREEEPLGSSWLGGYWYLEVLGSRGSVWVGGITDENGGCSGSYEIYDRWAKIARHFLDSKISYRSPCGPGRFLGRIECARNIHRKMASFVISLNPHFLTDRTFTLKLLIHLALKTFSRFSKIKLSSLDCANNISNELNEIMFSLGK